MLSPLRSSGPARALGLLGLIFVQDRLFGYLFRWLKDPKRDSRIRQANELVASSVNVLNDWMERDPWLRCPAVFALFFTCFGYVRLSRHDFVKSGIHSDGTSLLYAGLLALRRNSRSSLLNCCQSQSVHLSVTPRPQQDKPDDLSAPSKRAFKQRPNQKPLATQSANLLDSRSNEQTLSDTIGQPATCSGKKPATTSTVII